MEEPQNENLNISRSSFKEWLEKLQQESWQLELLISGFALFGIWEARELLSMIAEYQSVNRPSIGSVNLILGPIKLILSVGWRLFFINLLVHVISRGLWIGTIGLRYISSEINIGYFNYSPRFEEYLKSKVGSFDDYIERLEKFSSVIFAYTFLLFFLFVSFMMVIVFFTVFIAITGKIIDIQNHQELMGGVFIIFFGLAFLVFVDFITLGIFKKIREHYVSRGYYYIFRFFSIITLSFLYRPLLYNFLDEKYTRRLFLFSIPYIIIIAFVPELYSIPNPSFPVDNEGRIDKADQYEAFSYHYYDDEREKVYHSIKNSSLFKSPIHWISLESIELKGNYGKLFLRMNQSDGKWLEKHREIGAFYKSGLLFSSDGKFKKDSIATGLEKRKVEALSEIRKRKRYLRNQIREGGQPGDAEGIKQVNGKARLDDLYWKVKGDSVRTSWNERIERHKRQKIGKTKSSLLELSDIQIDGVPYTDSLYCKFYVHPHMQERGLLCFFPIHSLGEGPHSLNINRSYYDVGEDSLKVTSFELPFFIRN